MTQTITSYRIDRRAGQQGSRTGVAALAPDFEKYATELSNNNNIKKRLLTSKKSINLSTYNVRTLQLAHQIPELIATAITFHIDVINVQEHRLFHDDVILKYHDFGKGWTFVSASATKNARNATIG